MFIKNSFLFFFLLFSSPSFADSCSKIFEGKTTQANATTILGRAQTSNGSVIKVALLNEIQASTEDLIPFLLFMREKLSKEGYALVLPTYADSYDGTDEIKNYIDSVVQNISQNQVLINFAYEDENGKDTYSGDYNNLVLKNFNLDLNTVKNISIGFLKDSSSSELNLKKQILYGLIGLGSAFDFLDFQEVFKSYFTDKEKEIVNKEISKWDEVNQEEKRNFFRGLYTIWKLQNTQTRDKEEQNLNQADIIFILNTGYSSLLSLFIQNIRKEGVQKYREFLDINEYFFNMTSTRGDTVWFVAIREMVKILIEAGADINYPISSYGSLLNMFILNRSEEMSKIVIEAGADVNQGDSDGDTALHLAAREGFPGLVKMLLKYGANIEAKNNSGKTPLNEAIKSEKIEIAKILIGYGANIEFITSNKNQSRDKN